MEKTAKLLMEGENDDPNDLFGKIVTALQIPAITFETVPLLQAEGRR